MVECAPILNQSLVRAALQFGIYQKPYNVTHFGARAPAQDAFRFRRVAIRIGDIRWPKQCGTGHHVLPPVEVEAPECSFRKGF
jgi:hypothetical protein